MFNKNTICKGHVYKALKNTFSQYQFVEPTVFSPVRIVSLSNTHFLGHVKDAKSQENVRMFDRNIKITPII